MGKHDPKKKTFNYKSSGMVEDCEGVKGATADFVCFHCPLELAQKPANGRKINFHHRKKSFYFFLIRRKSRQEDTQWQKPLTYISK